LESFDATGMDLYTHDQSVAKRELVRERGLDGRTALLTRRSGADEHEHSLVVNIEVTLRCKADGFAPGTGIAERSKLLDASQQRLIRVSGCEVKLRIGREPRVVTQRTGSRKRLAHDLHVRLSHRYLRSWASRSAAARAWSGSV
jgi:hypothetical protein